MIWDASDVELEQISEYLGATWTEVHRR